MSSLVEEFLERYVRLPLEAPEEATLEARIERVQSRSTASARQLNQLLRKIEAAAKVPPGVLISAVLNMPGVTSASLSSTAISCVEISGLPEWARATNLMAALRELNLSDNNIENWETVAQVLQSAPNLSALDLSANPLGAAAGGVSAAEAFADTSHPLLRALVINGTHCDPSGARQLIKAAPGLERLYAAANGWTETDVAALAAAAGGTAPDAAASAGASAAAAAAGSVAEARGTVIAPCVAHVDLSGNPLSDAEALATALLPMEALTSLSVSGCDQLSCWTPAAPATAATTTTSDDTAAATSALSVLGSRLARLNAERCGISQLVHLDAIGAWPALRHLRIGHNPWERRLALAAAEQAGAAGRPHDVPRMLVVGRAPRLLDVGGAPVRRGEVEAAERFLVRYAASIAAAADGPGGADAADGSAAAGPDTTPPARLAELQSRYGMLGPLLTDLKPAVTVSVTVTFDGMGGSRVVRVPVKWPVAQVRWWAALLGAALQSGDGSSGGGASGETDAEDEHGGADDTAAAAAEEEEEEAEEGEEEEEGEGEGGAALGSEAGGGAGGGGASTGCTGEALGALPVTCVSDLVASSGLARMPRWWRGMEAAGRKRAMAGVRRARVYSDILVGAQNSRTLLVDGTRRVFGLGLGEGDGFWVQLR